MRICTVISLTLSLTFTLSGCEKPKPQITVTAGTNTVVAPALCWADDTPLDTTACSKVINAATKPSAVLPTVQIQRDQTIGVSVDPKVAKFGWNIRLADQNINPTTITSTYYRFTNPLGTTAANGQYLLILANSKAQGARGIWLYKIIQN